MHTFTARLRPARLAALGAAALLTLTGCLQADMGITLNDDESGEFRVRTVINREQFAELTEMFGGLGADDADLTPEDPCQELLDDDLSTDELPPGAVVEPINDGDWCGATATIPFANLDEFARLANEFADDSDDADATNLGAPSITAVDGGYRFEVTGLEMSDEGMGMGSEGGDEFADMFERLLGDMRITYDVRLPGKPLDHNADAVDGNRFQWTLEWGDTRTDLYAQTGPGEPDGSADTGNVSDSPVGDDSGSASGDDDGSSLTWLWILIGVVVVAGAVVAFVLYSKKNKGNGPTPNAPQGAGPVAGGTPPPPPPAPPAGSWQPPSEQ